MKILITVFTFLWAISAYSNLGHRGGCENSYYQKELKLPENSLICMRAGLIGYGGGGVLQHLKDFKYLEFDVRETKDNKLVVYHGRGSKGKIFIKKSRYRKSSASVPYNDYNKLVFESFRTGVSWKKVKVRDLNLAQITKLKLYGKYDQFVPSLRVYLQTAVKYGLLRPLMAELKDIYSEKGREKLLELIALYKLEYANQAKIELVEKPKKEFDFQTVGFMARKTKAKKIMGKSGSSTFKAWCKAFKDYGFLGIYKTTSSRKNYCK